MKIRQLLKCCFLLLMAGVSCKKKNETPVVVTPPAVYIGGYSQVDNPSPAMVGTYWKNGTATNLPRTRQIKSIIVSGTTTWLQSDSGYWKNGQYTPIPDISGTSSMFVNGTDVYLAAATNSPAAAGIYWKNGQAIAMPVTWNSGNSYSVLLAAVFVKGTDVYACGGIQSGGRDTAVFWKNGQMAYLPDGFIAGSIQVIGSDVYIAGLSSALRKSNKIGEVYWKNGVEFPLPDDFVACSMKGIGTDLYIVGYHGNGTIQPSYFKNGVETYLTGSGLALDIAVSGSDIHAVGFAGAYAVHWKNASLDTLGKGVAQSIFITQ